MPTVRTGDRHGKFAHTFSAACTTGGAPLPRHAVVVVALAAALIAVAFAELAGDRVVQAPAPAAATDARAEGVFTGEFVDGVPVYRLPSITVVADRDAEIARMHRDDSSAARQANARVGEDRKRNDRWSSDSRQAVRLTSSHSSSGPTADSRGRPPGRGSVRGSPGPQRANRASAGRGGKRCDLTKRSWPLHSCRCPHCRSQRRIADGRASTIASAYDASGAWNPNVYRGVVGALTVAEIGGAVWEGSETRFGKTLWQGVDSEIFGALGATAGKYIFTRVRPSTEDNPVPVVQGRLQLQLSRAAKRRSPPRSSPRTCSNTAASIRRPTRCCCCPSMSVRGESRTRRTGRRTCWRAGPSAGSPGWYAHSRDVPLTIELLPHGFQVGYRKHVLDRASRCAAFDHAAMRGADVGYSSGYAHPCRRGRPASCRRARQRSGARGPRRRPHRQRQVRRHAACRTRSTISSCSTSGSPTSTGSRFCAACAPGARRSPFSCSPRAMPSRTACTASTSAPTIT